MANTGSRALRMNTVCAQHAQHITMDPKTVHGLVLAFFLRVITWGVALFRSHRVVVGGVLGRLGLPLP